MKNRVDFWNDNLKENYQKFSGAKLGNDYDFSYISEIYDNKDFAVFRIKANEFSEKVEAKDREVWVGGSCSMSLDFSSNNYLVKQYTNDNVPALDLAISFDNGDKFLLNLSYLDKYDEAILRNAKFNHPDIPIDDYNKRPLIGEQKSGDNVWQLSFELDKSIVVYGLGDLMMPLNKRSYQAKMWNTDDPSVQLENRQSLYKSIPIIYLIKPETDEVWTLFFDNPSRAYFDICHSQKDRLIYAVEDSECVIYISYSSNLKEAYKKLTKLLSFPSVPKRSILGYHQSRWSYYSDRMIDDLLENFDKHRIPISAIHLDIDYMDGFRNFTYNAEAFSSLKNTSDRLKDNNIDLITIIDAGLKYDEAYPIYQECVERNILLPSEARSQSILEGKLDINQLPSDSGDESRKNQVQDNIDIANDDKEIEIGKKNYYFGWVWPGHTVFPDFEQSSCRQWWSEKIRDFVETNGLSGIWLDMNEPANFNGDLPDKLITLSQDDDRSLPIFHKNWHNRFANQMSMATYEGLKEARPDSRPFVFSRAAYAGLQKYAGAWTGDSMSIWSQLRMQLCQILTLSICGMGFISADIGGFLADTNKELYLRWLELGIFYPFVRNHSEINSSYQEPWAFDEETSEISRTLIELRYRMIPYIYDSMIKESLSSGLPLLRPMALEFNSDPFIYTINDQFMFADSILVAPILDPSTYARAIYLPAGGWYSFHSGEYIYMDKGGYILEKASLGHCPMFVKEGSIIPLAKREDTACFKERNKTACDELVVRYYVNRSQSKYSDSEKSDDCIRYRHYLDSGDGYSYLNNRTSIYDFYLEAGKLTYELRVGEEQLRYKSIEVEYIGR